MNPIIHNHFEEKLYPATFTENSQVDSINRDQHLTEWELLAFGTDGDYKGAEPETVNVIALCSKSHHNLVFGENSREHYWEPHVRHTFKQYKDDYKFTVNRWRNLFCSYSQEIFESNRDIKNLIKTTSDYVIKVMYGSDSIKKQMLNYTLLEPFEDDLQSPSSDVNAQYCLGVVYENSYGIYSKKAYKYYNLAADQGNISAKHHLNFYYQNGVRVNRDGQNKEIYRHKFVNECVIESALFRHSDKEFDIEITKKAMIAARSDYCLKILQRKNPELALKTYRYLKSFIKELSESLANRIGQYCLAIIYENGFGVPQDLDQAFQYAKLSADQGFDKAQENLKNLKHLNLSNNSTISDKFQIK